MSAGHKQDYLEACQTIARTGAGQAFIEELKQRRARTVEMLTTCRAEQLAELQSAAKLYKNLLDDLTRAK